MHNDSRILNKVMNSLLNFYGYFITGQFAMEREAKIFSTRFDCFENFGAPKLIDYALACMMNGVRRR